MFIIVGLFMIYKAHHDIVEYRSIIDDRLPNGFDGFNVFFISDIHRRKINLKTIKSIQTTIDIVVIGGDLTEKGVPLQRTRDNLRILKKLAAPVYFIWGNNDYEIDHEKLNNVLLDENIIIIKDSYIDITRNSDILSIIGLDYHEEQPISIDIDFEKFEDQYRLLLTHVPDYFYELNSYIQKNIHTVLAGHTHGGQIRIFGLGFYQRGGLHIFKQTKIFVSEGYGYTLLPFRLQTNAECHILTFKKQ
jgi:predicted MPP superfamily phosphohydrolase